MRKFSLFVVLTVAVAVGSCQKAHESAGPWFSGGLDAALVEAGARGSLVMLEFYSDT
jgi:hypothetical protein